MLEGVQEATEFDVETGDLADLEARPSGDSNGFWFLYDNKRSQLVKRFILGRSPKTHIRCVVTLIEKEGKLTPRFELSKRNNGTFEIAPEKTQEFDVKSRIDLGECRENLWRLVNFISSLERVEASEAGLSVVGRDEAGLVAAIKKRDPESVKSILRALAGTDGIALTQGDLNQILDRKGTLQRFEKGLDTAPDDEKAWQSFFNENKWIFGYGLNYQILGIEEAQPYFGGTGVDRKGGQRGDFLTATEGDIGFTVLVEIKTPGASLVDGTSLVRSGAWSLSRELTDALAQLQANTHTWEIDGSRTTANSDRLEQGSSTYTVRPKGILVIGRLDSLASDRTKWETFQRFRTAVHGFEILTYDEVLERARFIVAQEEDNQAF